MLSTVLRTIAGHALFERGDRVVVAVSGGPDSMALLHVLWELRDRLGLTLEVAGVDHGLRPAAAQELELVQGRAEALGLPFVGLCVDVARHRRGTGLQDAARRARLGALAALATERGARRVALGHQAADQAETILFRIVRGTGLAGLQGIPYRRDPFVRPLLDVPRAEILRYLRRRSIPFVDDPSNADLRFARARIRHRHLPALAEENPRVVEALVALAAAARAASPARDASSPQIAGLVAEPALSRRVAAVVDRLRARGGTAAVDIAGGRRVEVSYGAVRVGARASVRPPATASAPVVIDGPGTYRWAASRLDVKERARRGARGAGGVAAEFDADLLEWPLLARFRKSGDRMRPRGGRGSRKLSDLMIDARIARATRAALPVVTSARGELLFVPGLRPAESARPTARTRRIVIIGFVPEAMPEDP
ncbi:MAG TPA: tRNA lysidine(34) synthetase TilS [Polyangia bacterium]|nr:tRNA lysidine(34) synthetase TilS [Polyangia bacterium]